MDHFLHKNPNRLPNDDLSRLHVIVCICKGMTEIHNLGIVHRDLKCANILLRWLPGFDLPEVVIIGMFFPSSKFQSIENIVL